MQVAKGTLFGGRTCLIVAFAHMDTQSPLQLFHVQSTLAPSAALHSPRIAPSAALHSPRIAPSVALHILTRCALSTTDAFPPITAEYTLATPHSLADVTCVRTDSGFE